MCQGPINYKINKMSKKQKQKKQKQFLYKKPSLGSN